MLSVKMLCVPTPVPPFVLLTYSQPPHPRAHDDTRLGSNACLLTLLIHSPCIDPCTAETSDHISPTPVLPLAGSTDSFSIPNTPFRIASYRSLGVALSVSSVTPNGDHPKPHRSCATDILSYFLSYFLDTQDRSSYTILKNPNVAFWEITAIENQRIVCVGVKFQF